MTIIYEKEQLAEVVKAIQQGKVIAFPTDTVYGLGVRYFDEAALEQLKKQKDDQRINQFQRWWRIKSN